MPRPNAPRTIAGEHSLARRVAHERESRRMSYEGLASRMVNVGCPINASAIYKIEKSDPPRRITVDELVAFSKVFDIAIDQLLLPPEVVASGELRALVVAWDEATVLFNAATVEERESRRRLQDFVAEHPELAESLEGLVDELVSRQIPDTEQGLAMRPIAFATFMYEVTGAKEWDQRADELAEKYRAARRG